MYSNAENNIIAVERNVCLLVLYPRNYSGLLTELTCNAKQCN
jgi:hypothetical protein